MAKTILDSNLVAFNAASKQVTFNNNGFKVGRLLAIINLTREVIIYAVGSASLGFSTLNNNTITLDFDTTTHSNADLLQCIYDDDAIDIAIENTDANLQGLLAKLSLMANGNSQMRVVIDAISANLTLSTITTVTTVTSLINQSQIGGQLANPLIPSMMNMAAFEGNYRNIIIT